MPRYAYVNGRYVPHPEAKVHVEDRGYQFADGVYEVIAVRDGKPIDEAGHLDRLDRSLRELCIAWPVSRRVLEMIVRELMRRNGLRDGLVYMQVTRGVAPRDFKFPKGGRSSLVLTTRRAGFPAGRLLDEGVAVVTVPDIRWARRDIKSVALLPQVLGKQAAAEAGAFEAWQVDPDGTVTEGTSSNAWIVTADGRLVTRPPTTRILNGITRQTLIRLAAEEGVPFEERPFTVEEARAAREAFLSSASTFLLPVVRIDGRPVGEGRPGPIGRRLRERYLAYAAETEPVT